MRDAGPRSRDGPEQALIDPSIGLNEGLDITQLG